MKKYWEDIILEPSFLKSLEFWYGPMTPEMGEALVAAMRDWDK